MKLVYFTRHEWLGASTRYRSLQYFDLFEAAGFKISNYPFFTDQYLRDRATDGKPVVRIAKSYLRRFVSTLTGLGDADAIIVEKEMFPFLPAITDCLARRLSVPLIYDYDDAIWHAYERRNFGPFGTIFRNKIPRVIRRADHIVAGSHYIEDQLRTWGARRVTRIPTTLSTSRYAGQGLATEKTAEIVWIGSMSTGQYLLPLFPVLERIAVETGARVRVIGFSPSLIKGSVPNWLQIEPWSHETELDLMASGRIGIMPIPDDPYERGKCGFKLVQYMGLGLPTVASPVGENRYIVRHGETGFLAETTRDWYLQLLKLIAEPDTAAQMGRAGRSVFLREYSTEAASHQWIDLLKSEIQKRA